MESWLMPITLERDIVRLIPLDLSHRQAMLDAASDGKLWDLWFTTVPSENSIDHYIDEALVSQQHQKALPFAVVWRKENKIIGSTRYCNAEPAHRRLEIGYTWYAKSHQRSKVNAECKYLLLAHAFEQLKCIAVEFRTHFHNFNSRRAIEALGAKQDGVLRNHRIEAQQRIRDTVVYSILNTEWEAVKTGLLHRLNQD